MPDRIEFVGGPLDGCVAEAAEKHPGIWSGPDPTDPENKAIVYLLLSKPKLHYKYDQDVTNKANARLAEVRRTLDEGT